MYNVMDLHIWSSKRNARNVIFTPSRMIRLLACTSSYKSVIVQQTRSSKETGERDLGQAILWELPLQMRRQLQGHRTYLKSVNQSMLIGKVLFLTFCQEARFWSGLPHCTSCTSPRAGPSSQRCRSWPAQTKCFIRQFMHLNIVNSKV